MKFRMVIVSPILAAFCLGTVLTAQVSRNHDISLKNWPAPLYWQSTPAETASGLRPELRTPAPEAVTPPGALVFVAMTPCRVVDTRASQMFPAAFGAPSLTPGPARSFPIQSSLQCPIPTTAQAYSFNVTVIPPGPLGFLTVWPTGQPQPNAVTLDDFPTGDIRNNAAIVPAGTPNGSVSAVVNANTDLVIDINGYYAPSTGITLAQGTAVAPSLSFSGDAATGIFSSGASTLNFATGGTNRLSIRPDGDLDLLGSIRRSGTLFLHNIGTGNTGVGFNALPVNTGSYHTASGYNALSSNTTGDFNTATGAGALAANVSGSFDTATGVNALFSNTGGGSNAAFGNVALYNNITGSNNNAIGVGALYLSSTSSNTAVGNNALNNSTTGASNIAVGRDAGTNNTTGSNNIDIGNPGAGTDNGIIRIGTPGTHTAFVAAGVWQTHTNPGPVPVLIDQFGLMGTQSSSRRYKEDIEDMSDASSGLLRLRPVTFRYREPYTDGSKPIDYGLIAEEVAEVYPDLVVKGQDGKVETVQYQKLIPMLLNEVQKEHETNQELQAQVTALRKALETLVASQNAVTKESRP